MADFLNRVEFVQNISDYDREQLEELSNLRQTIEDEEAKLQEEKESQEKMEEELASQKEELNARAAATSTDLAALRIRLKVSVQRRPQSRQRLQRKQQRRRQAVITLDREAIREAVPDREVHRAHPAGEDTTTLPATVC